MSRILLNEGGRIGISYKRSSFDKKLEEIVRVLFGIVEWILLGRFESAGQRVVEEKIEKLGNSEIINMVIIKFFEIGIFLILNRGVLNNDIDVIDFIWDFFK